MNAALWTVQGIVGLVFSFSGITKATWSRERLIEKGQTGAKIVPMALLRPVAVLEILGVLGLILPRLTGIAEWLTPWAATGLGVVMMGAIGIHVRLREPLTALGTLLILFACAFIVVGRS